MRCAKGATENTFGGRRAQLKRRKRSKRRQLFVRFQTVTKLLFLPYATVSRFAHTLRYANIFNIALFYCCCCGCCLEFWKLWDISYVDGCFLRMGRPLSSSYFFSNVRTGENHYSCIILVSSFLRFLVKQLFKKTTVSVEIHGFEVESIRPFIFYRIHFLV